MGQEKLTMPFKTNQGCNSPLIIATLASVFLATSALAGNHMGHGSHNGGHMTTPTQQGSGHGKMHSPNATIGTPGKKSNVTRSIEIKITDNRYSPEEITVKKGETIRFVLKNDGAFVHEFNIGTAQMHKGHRKEMMMMVEHGALEPDRINHARMKMDMGGGKTMEHNAPNSVLLEPKKSKEIIWKFDTDGKLEFACNVPGHYESGMVGKISIH
jgi:uncharacterized cupredoxin-like copper-binding protein